MSCIHDKDDRWYRKTNSFNEAFVLKGVNFKTCPFCEDDEDIKKEDSVMFGIRELGTADEIAEDIKNKFIASMRWKGANSYDADDVQTILLGNLNTITYRFAEAIQAERSRMERAIQDFRLERDKAWEMKREIEERSWERVKDLESKLHKSEEALKDIIQDNVHVVDYAGNCMNARPDMPCNCVIERAKDGLTSCESKDENINP